jgi:predicted ATPase
MAPLWRDQGKRDKARDLLAPVYSWFTEGFDTLDLKEAKKLIDELASCGARARSRRIMAGATYNRFSQHDPSD